MINIPADTDLVLHRIDPRPEHGALLCDVDRADPVRRHVADARLGPDRDMWPAQDRAVPEFRRGADRDDDIGNPLGSPRVSDREIVAIDAPSIAPSGVGPAACSLRLANRIPPELVIRRCHWPHEELTRVLPRLRQELTSVSQESISARPVIGRCTVNRC
jgi:hypothetical protein